MKIFSTHKRSEDATCSNVNNNPRYRNEKFILLVECKFYATCGNKH